MTAHTPAPPTITLDPDSYTCPDCGIVSVPSDDRGARPVDDHRCT